MKDKDKTREQLINELNELRQRNAELEISITRLMQTAEELRALDESLKRSIDEHVKEFGQAQQELQETRNYLESLFNCANVPIIVWDPEFRITRFSRAFEHLTGYMPEEVIGRKLRMLFPEESMDESLARIESTLGGEYWKSVEMPILCKDGNVLTALWNSANIYAGDGTTIIATIAQGTDITEIRRSEEQIKASLRDKEALLKEVHHRVKNNLQVISSLLNLQLGYIKDKQVIEIFRESQNRVKLMALIHEKLYQSEDLTVIDFGEYIRELAAYIYYSYRANSSIVALKINAGSVLLDINTAISCGLIINELVSNSLKYAFTECKEGEIYIELHSDNNMYTLIFSDNGVGFPDDLDFRSTETLGLQLVITLIKQLKGTIEINRSGGTRFKITFPYNR
ncbi:MAG: PAS domain S-box protein [Methanophagales archaeon]|nr:PAS domain S-box protein [Methanophagales archaeon]